MTNDAIDDIGDDVYVSVLGVDATGRTTLLSLAHSERGIHLSFTKPTTRLVRDQTYRKGLPILWPEAVLSKGESVSEHFVFVLTDKELDIRFLETPRAGLVGEAKGAPSGFPADSTVRYHVVTVRYKLWPEGRLSGLDHDVRALAESEAPPRIVLLCIPEAQQRATHVQITATLAS